MLKFTQLKPNSKKVYLNKRMIIPYSPLYIENQVPVFSSNDINLFGKPDLYNITTYLVIDQDPSPLDYHKCPLKKILPYHQYNRNERFKSILNCLMGKGKIPFEVFEQVINNVDYANESELWRNISTILSKSGNCKYVNRIPIITSKMGYPPFFHTRRLEFILERFYKASARFDHLKDRDQLDGRKYFPNLRYVAFRLLAEHEAKFNYPVILLKTKSKLAPMDALYNKLFI
jgi:hypothetical protein